MNSVAVFKCHQLYEFEVLLKLDPDKDFRWSYHADHGIDLYSNGVMVSPNSPTKSRRRSKVSL